MTPKPKAPTVVRELAAAPHNPRAISEKRLAQLGRSMAKFGDLSSVVFNRRSGHLVSGHQRVKHLPPSAKIETRAATDETGTIAVGRIGKWPFRLVDWDEKTEKAACVAANAAGGEFDDVKLSELVAGLDKMGYDLDLLGLKNLHAILASNSTTVQDEVPATPKAPVTQPGDLWILGPHRLLCGDSTMARNVERLMAGEKAVCLWSDPPYGVDYVGKTKDKMTLQNDGAEGLPQLLAGAFSAADTEALAEGAAIYVAHPAGALSVTFGNAFLAAGWRLHETLAWVKDSMVLGHSDYHYRHEPILYGYKNGPGRTGRGGTGWYGSNSETSVLEFARPKRSAEHPTMKPVDLVAYCLNNSSPRGGVVFDPFLGSGTTLISAEQIGRRCCGLELSPAFCDVIVRRWEALTGKKAERER